MFAPRYFPVRYFAGRYYNPPGGIGPEEPESTAGTELFVKKGHGKKIKVDRGKSIMISDEGVIDV